MKNILFLCTGNSARSIMAEAYFNHVGHGEWRAYSAGSNPKEAPNPFALEVLAKNNISLRGGDGPLRSKSWNEFAEPQSPRMHFVITVCDNAAAETCPVWPANGEYRPEKLHWSFPDPAAAIGDDSYIRSEFARVFADIRNQIDRFVRAKLK